MAKLNFATDADAVRWADPPVPAQEELPQWYRDLPAEIPQGPNNPRGTAKKCAPFMDAFGLGYLVKLPVAAHVHVELGHVFFSWRDESPWPPIGQHHIEQVAGSAFPNIYKFQIPWVLELPEGYSALYTHPLNRYELPFLTLSGVVDDTYKSHIAMPFTWLAPDGDYTLDAGLVVGQVIPFVREDYEGEVVVRDQLELLKDGHRAVSRLDGYRREFHVKKVYR